MNRLVALNLNGLFAWIKDQTLYLFYIFVIVVVLVAILEILKVIGIESFLKKILVPPLRFFGISESAMNIIIVGMTIGLQFGGGILIKEVNSGKIDKQSVFLSVMLINLIHAIIEDTLLMIAVGGHFSGVVFARVIFGLLISLFILLMNKNFNLIFEKYVFTKKLKELPNPNSISPKSYPFILYFIKFLIDNRHLNYLHLHLHLHHQNLHLH